MGIVPEQFQCDHIGCTAVRREVNNWLAVLLVDGYEVCIYEWDRAVHKKVLKKCKHFCGVAHALHFVSQSLEKKTEPTEQQ